ncbi:MAG: hypothetical protein GY807_03035 [Gammaproteobacteria bacterium]|nr:hypothetical protein [Gammaproteobacteria bacterium]
MKACALGACLITLVASPLATAQPSYEAKPGLLPMGGFILFFDSEGPLSYVTSAPGDLPDDIIPLGEVKGRGCQYGLSIPLLGASSIIQISGGVGRGGYGKALKDIKLRYPELTGLYDVKIDDHFISVLTMFRRICVEITAKGFK